MDVYEFLDRPVKIDHEVRRIRERIAALRGCLLPKGIRYDADRVQTSPEDTMSRISAEIADLEAQAGQLLDDKARAVAGIARAIDALEDEREKDVLTLYYIGRKSVRRIAEELHYSRRWVIRLKRSGVTKLSQRVHLSSPPHVL